MPIHVESARQPVIRARVSTVLQAALVRAANRRRTSLSDTLRELVITGMRSTGEWPPPAEASDG